MHRHIASKHLYVRAERKAMNDSITTVWISSQRPALLVTPACSAALEYCTTAQLITAFLPQISFHFPLAFRAMSPV